MAEPARLPAQERLDAGLRDLREGRATGNALWVAQAETRLRHLGVEIPDTAWLPEERELAFYELLGEETEDPYYRYNSLRAELDSLISALEARRARASA